MVGIISQVSASMSFLLFCVGVSYCFACTVIISAWKMVGGGGGEGGP